MQKMQKLTEKFWVESKNFDFEKCLCETFTEIAREQTKKIEKIF